MCSSVLLSTAFWRLNMQNISVFFFINRCIEVTVPLIEYILLKNLYGNLSVLNVFLKCAFFYNPQNLSIFGKMFANNKNFTVENGVYIGPQTHQSVKYRSLGELMWFNIKSHGDKIAHLDVCTDETFTYAELQDKIVRCANWMQREGIKSGDVISVCTHNHPNSIVPCLSAAYVNAIFNPWNENMNLQTTLYILQLTTPKMIFCNEKTVDVILSAIKAKNYSLKVVVFGKHASAISFNDILKNCIDAEIANFRYAELNDIKQTSCIMHSSGTTGMPKGVELSNYTMMLISEDKNFETTNIPILSFSSLCWISGTMLNMKAIAQGAKMIIYPEFDEEITCKLIEKYKVVFMYLTTSMMNRFYRAGYAKQYSLLSLKTIVIGGAIFKPKVQEELRRTLPHVQIMQGMTEASGLVTFPLPHHKNGSCGVIGENMQIKVVDSKSGKVLGPNQSGEIWIKSALMMNGYYRNPEATKSTIDEEGWLRSGDIGYVDEDGEIFIIDRIKDIIRYREYDVSPGEIEGVLLLHPAVMEAAVLSIPHEIDINHPFAYVTIKPEAKVTEQELIDFVAKNMMDHCKLRAGVIFLDAFPYTGSGKIARKDLEEMAKKLFKY
ncbi:4-coumarate--CoA ligase-like 7 isoform X2 [Solenopsis invicta]|uniref:4-coumarate--CoA ligase-like 7 isoform X2 n=1 Tax=Solenopsis invicta TaxID=13686 RepID=UPI00193D52EC|nr:4-coumarate--CoA ligase-like 7 isoform X2 [Solenopsis invicta]